MKPPDNGERVRSLLCGREVLARPSGMAEQHEEGGRFISDKCRKKITGIRKGNPFGAAVYTSLTCLTLFTAEGSDSKQIANR